MSVSFEDLCARLDAMGDQPTALAVELANHEQLLRVGSFDLNDAWVLGSALHAQAAERELPVVISIMLGEQRAFHVGLPGATEKNDNWARRKTNTVMHFARSSFAVGVNDIIEGSSIHDRLAEDGYAAHGGAFPLTTEQGHLLGAVAVSGLPSAHDHALVVTELATFLGRSAELN